MKKIGIIGGLSPASTTTYYSDINDLINKKVGGHSSAKIILESLDFGEFCALKEKGDWGTQGKLLCAAALRLKNAGADFIVIATNTMHKMADDIQKAIDETPLLHIADATAEVALSQGISKIAFLGTKYSMELDFYTGRLEDKGLDVLIPEKDEREEVSRIIYDELTKNIIKPSSEEFYIQTINQLKSQGAEAVILGCTEIGMLINKDNSPLRVLDTTLIHIERAVDLALG